MRCFNCSSKLALESALDSVDLGAGAGAGVTTFGVEVVTFGVLGATGASC